MTDWTTPVNVSSGTASSSDFNSEVLDNLRHLKEWDLPLINGDAGSHVAGDVVVLDTTTPQTGELCTSVGQAHAVACRSATVLPSEVGYYATVGPLIVKVQGTVAVGNALQTSATAGRAQVGTANAFAVALSSNASGAGTVLAVLRPPPAGAVASGTADHSHTTAGTDGGPMTSPRLVTDTRNSAGTVREQFVGANTLSVAIGSAALATTATEGFYQISSSAGPPTGTPTLGTGRIPIHWDATNKRLYLYDGAWRLIGGTVPQVRVVADAVQSLDNNTHEPLQFNAADRWDTDGMHFTSAAALTGTVAKSGTTALVGTGTSFTTELSVGQVIDVPGTAVERRVVTAIADNLNLTVNTTFAHTASGQTATRVNEAIVCRLAGLYRMEATCGINTNATGARSLRFRINGTTIIAQSSIPPNGAVSTTLNVGITYPLALWDYLTVEAFQNSGAGLDTVILANSSPECSVTWDSVAA